MLLFRKLTILLLGYLLLFWTVMSWPNNVPKDIVDFWDNYNIDVSHLPGVSRHLFFSVMLISEHVILKWRHSQRRAGNRLQAVGRLIVLLMEINELDQFKLKLLKDMLSLESFYEDYQEWEEAVAQSISYIHNNIFKKSEKDKEKLTPLTEQGILSHVNFKRLLKQIKLILDQMFSEVLISKKDETLETTEEKNIMRIEELVEVI